MSVLSGVRRVWQVLKPPPPSPDGTMSLYDHLRELRYRVIVSALAVVIKGTLAALFYRQMLNLVLWPWNSALVDLKQVNPDVDTQVVNREIDGTIPRPVHRHPIRTGKSRRRPQPIQIARRPGAGQRAHHSPTRDLAHPLVPIISHINVAQPIHRHPISLVETSPRARPLRPRVCVWLSPRAPDWRRSRPGRPGSRKGQPVSPAGVGPYGRRVRPHRPAGV